MDPVLEPPREREEVEDDTCRTAPEPEARVAAYVFDGWGYEPLTLAQ